MLALYALTSFLSAALLFVVQPMFGKLLLPSYGGASAVWNTCVFFFESALLAGYAYAHVARRVPRQRLLHLVIAVAAATVLPLRLPGWAAPPPSQPTPVLHLVFVLVVSVGLPFVVLSATAPLLQHWFSRTHHALAHDPYFLYAAGNAGSFVGLLAYPIVVERVSTLHAQRLAWSIGYGVLVVLLAGCAITGTVQPNATARVVTEPTEALTWRRRTRWVVLAALPSSLMLGTTTHMTTDVAAVPLLWVIPLAVYLLTFVAAFGADLRRVRAWSVTALPGLAAVVAVQLVYVRLAAPAEMALDIVVLAVAALACHSTLAADRPSAAKLTEFYLLLSFGGMLGGAFNGLMAPLVFQSLVEYPAALAMTVVLLAYLSIRRRRPTVRDLAIGVVGTGATWAMAAGLRDTHWHQPAVAIAVVCAAVGLAVLARRTLVGVSAATVVLLAIPLVPRPALLRERTFYGIYRVTASHGQHTLMHGAVVHGAESTRADGYLTPETYYTRAGPVGQLFRAYARRPIARSVAIVGLGAGSLAAYSRTGDRYTFYELDPAIARIARDPRYFTFLQHARGDVNVVLGDGRLRLSQQQPHSFGIIVLDAFSSDAIPVHLLTVDAVHMYLDKLDPQGLLVFHVSNRFLALAPVLASVARSVGVVGLTAHDPTTSRTDDHVPSDWVVLARDPAVLGPLRRIVGWQPLPRATMAAWTDDYSNVFAALK